MKKAAVHNLGCKVNAYEAEAMEQLLVEAGYEIVPFEEKADVYVINTCSVTAMADKKSRQMLHRARRRNEAAIVIAAGCYVQTAEEELKKDLAVDILLGTNQKGRLIELIEEFEETGARQESRLEIDRPVDYESFDGVVSREHTRAFLKVQDGCNQFCSYCIIPFARGRVRSESIDHVVKDVRKLADEGVKEVVITGIHLSSFGLYGNESYNNIDKNTREDRESLLGLLQAVNEIEGIERIRLGSLEPQVITEEFAEGIAGLDKVCPHFHLSLQSGSDTVLKRMNRQYDTAQYEQACNRLKKVYEAPALTTDIIVGFPGETEEEFCETLDFVRRIGFYELHVFKYSKRPGTRAATMPDQVDEQVKNIRSEKLIELGEEQKKAYIRSFDGKRVSVLLEEEVEIRGKKMLTGFTERYVRAYAKTGSINSIVSVEFDSDIY